MKRIVHVFIHNFFVTAVSQEQPGLNSSHQNRQDYSFFSLEDEFGLIDVTAFEKTYRQYGALLFTKPVPALQVSGVLQRRGNGFSVIARKIARI